MFSRVHAPPPPPPLVGAFALPSVPQAGAEATMGLPLPLDDRTDRLPPLAPPPWFPWSFAQPNHPAPPLPQSPPVRHEARAQGERLDPQALRVLHPAFGREMGAPNPQAHPPRDPQSSPSASAQSAPWVEEEGVSESPPLNPKRKQGPPALPQQRGSTDIERAGQRGGHAPALVQPRRGRPRTVPRNGEGPRPYVCGVQGCPMAFSQSGGLSRHARTHTGERPFKCPHPGCDSAFGESGNLTRHVRTHTGERPYLCNFGCGAAFTSSSHQRRHEVVHTGAKRYVCEVCGKAFSQNSGLCAHKHRHNNNNRP